MADIKMLAIPFGTPNFVLLKYAHSGSEGPKLPINAVDADVLSQMCDDFRAEIFRRAGKPDPAQEGR